MSAVNVLAVMDEVLRRTEAAMPTPLDLPGESRMCPEHHAGYEHDIREARAAVAELIEAAADFVDLSINDLLDSEDYDRLRAALARVGGTP